MLCDRSLLCAVYELVTMPAQVKFAIKRIKWQEEDGIDNVQESGRITREKFSTTILWARLFTANNGIS